MVEKGIELRGGCDVYAPVHRCRKDWGWVHGGSASAVERAAERAHVGAELHDAELHDGAVEMVSRRAKASVDEQREMDERAG